MSSLLLLNGCAGFVSGANTTALSTVSIANVQAASTTTSATQITWTTDVASNSLVSYGTTTSYGSSTPVDPTMVTSHQVALSGLSAGTTYYFQVQSADSKNNSGKSGGHKFGTAGVNISGTITPTNGGSAATVTLSGTSSATTTANGSGAYSFTGLATGSYVVTPANSGYSFSPASQNVTLGTANMAGVNFSATATTTAPTITTQPANQTVTAGQAATFSVIASGTTPLSYQWQKNGANITGATSSSYITPATTTSDSGSTFVVVVSNSAGSATSNAATLTVNAAVVAPSITTQPTNQTVTAGQTATFSVIASGTAPLSYQWQKNGANISGATSSSYTTPATTTSDSGSTFDVVVSNSAGTATSTAATLTVNPAPVAPTITTQPVNQTVTAGQTATFTVTATGMAPLSYQWQKNSANISGATSSRYTTPATITSDSGSTFVVVVSNSAGSATSNAATLSVTPAPVAPSITTQPTNQTVTSGQTATFSVAASGTAPLSYQWQKNGANITGATSSSYTTTATTTSDSGSTFDVVVSNSAGTATSTTATLAVNPAPAAPTITTQPVNQTVTPGQTATFTVVASGTAPLSYQWQKNGTNIAAATSSSYTTPATTTADSGSTFDVVVSNSAGTVTSSAVTLTVNAPAINLSSASISFVNDVIGGTMTQPLAITNTGTTTLTITQINESGSTFFSATGYSLPLNINAGKQSTITVGFLPTVSGTVSGSLSIVSNAPTSPTAVTLSGTGVAATFTLGISPTTLGFGNVNVGSSSSQNVTVTNTGNSNVTISGVTTSGAGFSASGLSANTILTPSQSATLSVSFAPAATGSVTGSVSVASNATNSPAVVMVSGSGVSSTSTLPTCGKLNDSNIYLPPNYDTFSPPAKGQSYTDPVFGCKITRITDSTSALFGANHFYNTTTPFNASDTYLMLSQSNGSGFGGPMVVDLSGNIVVSQSNMPGSNSAILPWDTTNPNVFYYTSGNQFIKGTITGTAPNATVTSTVLATFSQYASAVIPGDMDISNDGLHIWLTNAPDMGGDSYTADVFLVTLNAGSGNATSAAMGAAMPSVAYHKLQIVPNNGVSVEGPNQRTIYNTNGSVFEVPGGGTGNHTDWGLDTSGKMVAASIWYPGTAQNGCPSGWGYSLLDLASNTVRSCLNDGIQNVGNASHNSARDTQSGHWIVFSDDDSGTCPSSSYWCFNNPTNMSGWALYTGEILIWDGLGNSVRLAHHRSRSDENYWAQTRAAISRDGKYIVFDSNYNQSNTSGGINYQDVYLIGPMY